MIKAIIFDLGGVILLQNEMEMGQFISKIFDIEIVKARAFYKKHRKKLQIGEITSKELLLNAKERFSSGKSIKALYSEWSNLYRQEVIGLNTELLKLINKLKKNLRIYLFTNTIDTHAEYFDSVNPTNYFHKIYKSFEVGVIKPEANTYQFLLKEIKNEPNEIIFIDDLSENVISAEKVGMKGIIFKNTDQLKAELGKLGVKI